MKRLVTLLAIVLIASNTAVAQGPQAPVPGLPILEDPGWIWSPQPAVFFPTDEVTQEGDFWCRVNYDRFGTYLGPGVYEQLGRPLAYFGGQPTGGWATFRLVCRRHTYGVWVWRWGQGWVHLERSWTERLGWVQVQ